ncbi:hypothetical protein KM043_017219 [Ampulex compressa]|nr:hypothetical protein KM043_017219 [Ampulex compressa]
MGQLLYCLVHGASPPTAHEAPSRKADYGAARVGGRAWNFGTPDRVLLETSPGDLRGGGKEGKDLPVGSCRSRPGYHLRDKLIRDLSGEPEKPEVQGASGKIARWTEARVALMHGEDKVHGGGKKAEEAAPEKAAQRHVPQDVEGKLRSGARRRAEGGRRIQRWPEGIVFRMPGDKERVQERDVAPKRGSRQESIGGDLRPGSTGRASFSSFSFCAATLLDHAVALLSKEKALAADAKTRCAEENENGGI